MGASCSLDIKSGQDARTTNLNIWDAPELALGAGIHSRSVGKIERGLTTKLNQKTLYVTRANNLQFQTYLQSISDKYNAKLVNQFSLNCKKVIQKRLRDLGITIGHVPTGLHNAITDVPGILVGHHSVIQDEPHIARTGVTMIVPRNGEIWNDYAFAGCHSFNGNGEMTGLLWLEESGMLGSPIGITNTHAVGTVRDALVSYCVEYANGKGFLLPIVAETYDGWLNDINAFHITKQHTYQALISAKGGLVTEGNVGGGTGMICHEFKGGIGTSSRLVNTLDTQYTLGVLVQANYGKRSTLRVNGVPIGYKIDQTKTPLPWDKPAYGNSIIVIIATDAPLLPVQCKRLAKRATIGLARAGGLGYNSSGDIFLAFATGNHLQAKTTELQELKMLPHEQIDVFFDAVVEAVEESIINALTAAETMSGFQGHTAYALPLDELQKLMIQYRPYD